MLEFINYTVYVHFFVLGKCMYFQGGGGISK